MKRHSAWAAVYVFLAPVVAQPQSIEKSMVDRIKNAVVYIEQKRSIPVAGQDFTFSGTGFFISRYGRMVTNYHVVQETVPAGFVSFPARISEMRIVMNSGSSRYRVLRGRVVAIDKENDLAILQTDTAGVPFLDIGQKKNLAETTPVWAFGYPLGSTFALIQRGPEISVTRGTVSALRHNDRGLLTAVQVDATINPGNSGGPLVDQSGTIVGIVSRAGGTTGLNFAVPLYFLDSLHRKLPPRPPAGDSCVIDIVSVPAKASVYLDHIYKGETPLVKLTVERTRHPLLVAKEGFESWITDTVVTADQRFAVTLKTVSPLSLLVGTETAAHEKCGRPPAPLSPTAQDLLFTCDFNDTAEFGTWQQETGGTAARTWFMENGVLHQYESNEMLHAIFLGDTGWTDYVATAKVKINDSHNDSRAGLIFRENADGFYLFRIHRESNKAQLAYHSRHPFGWFVLAEKKIGMTIGDAWHPVIVSVSGGRIACYLDKSCVFRTSAAYSSGGRIGFYSVESKASFDSCVVRRAAQERPAGPLSPPKGLVSFWFTDQFDLHSTWWRQYSPDASPAYTWQHSEGGSVQPRCDGETVLSECTRYRLRDFMLQLTITAGDTGKEPRIGVVFRKNGSDYCAVELSKKDSRIRLVRQTRSKRKTLKEKVVHEPVFGRTSRIELFVKGRVVECRLNNVPVLKCKKRSLPTCEGTIGLVTAGVPAVYHTMTVSSLAGKR